MAMIRRLLLFLCLLFSFNAFAETKISIIDLLKDPTNKQKAKLFLQLDKKVINLNFSSLKNAKKINADPNKVARALKVLKLLENQADDDDVLDSIDKLVGHFNYRLEQLKNSATFFTAFVSLQYFNWQDNFSITNLTSKKSVEYNSMNRGPCFGGGIEYGNQIWKISGDICLGLVSVFSSGENGETGLSSYYINTTIGAQYFLSEKSRIGLGLPVIFRMADYTVPNNSSLDGTTYLNFGASVNYYYDIFSSVQFFTGVGGIIGSGTLLWNNGLKVTF